MKLKLIVIYLKLGQSSFLYKKNQPGEKIHSLQTAKVNFSVINVLM